MGFGYKDWKGVFYPSEMDASQYLNYYSRVFNSVEIDSTFYGTPRKSTMQQWAAATPTDFKFSLKVPRLITHELSLVNAWGLMAEFIEAARILAERLGVILFQFPPSFTFSQVDNLADFLDKIPADLRFAVEIRDSSWFKAQHEFIALLKHHQVAWASTQYPGLPEEIHRTANFLYIRWIGQHGSFQKHDRERLDRMVDFKRWFQIILEGSADNPIIFGYFNNDYAGYAAGSALKFKALLGQPATLPEKPQQPRLF